MFHTKIIFCLCVCALVLGSPVHAISRFLNVTKLERELKFFLYFSGNYCGLTQPLVDFAPSPVIPCGLRFRLLAVTSQQTMWYPVIETLPSFGRLWLKKTSLRQYDTPIDRVPWPLTEFIVGNSVTEPEDFDKNSPLYWEPDRNSPNQWQKTKNNDPTLRDVTPGVFKWYAEEQLSKNRSVSQTVKISGIPEREPPVPGGVGAMGIFDGINDFLVLQPIPVGLKEMDISLWIKCGAYANKQVIMFAEAQLPTQFPSDNVVTQSCESKVLFSIFETSNIKISILGGNPIATGLSVCNSNAFNSWHFLRVTMRQLQSSATNSQADGLTVSVSVDMGSPVSFNSTAMPLMMSKVSIGADTRCDSTPQGACMNFTSGVVTCLQPFSGLLDEIRFFDRIRPTDYVLWDWKRGWSKHEIKFYESEHGITTLFSVTFEETDSFGQSQIWGNGNSDYSPAILPSTSPVFSFNKSFYSIESIAARVPKEKGCGVDALSSVVQFKPRVSDTQLIPIQSTVIQQQPKRGCVLTLKDKSVTGGFKEGNLITAEYLDELYSYYGIYGSSAYRLVSLGTFYDTFVYVATADYNSEKLSSYGLVTLLASPGASWDNSYTYSMRQDTTMIFSPRIYNVDYESVRVQIWSDPLPESLFQVVSLDENGNFVLGPVLRALDFISHPKLLLAFSPPRYKSYPKQRLAFSALKYEFKVTNRLNPQEQIYACKVDKSNSCNLGSFFINVEPVKISPSWASNSLTSSTIFDVDAETQPVISIFFEDPDSSDFLVSVHQYPAKGKLYEYSSTGGLGIPIPVTSDHKLESWITAVLDASDASMIKDGKSLIGNFDLDESLVSLKQNVVLSRGQTCVVTAQFGQTPLYANSVHIYGMFSDQIYVYVDGSNYGDGMSKNDQDWFPLYSGYLQPSNTTFKNAINFFCEVPLTKQKSALQFCPQRLKASSIFRFRFIVPLNSPLAFVSSIFVSGTAAPLKYGFKSFDVIDSKTYRARFIYASPLLYSGPDYMIIAVTDCTSMPVLKNVTFNMRPKSFPAVPELYSQNLTAIGGGSVVGSFKGFSIQNSAFDVVYLGSDAPIIVSYRNSSQLKEGSVLMNHLLFGTDVLITPPAFAGGFPYATIRYGFLDNGVQSPYVGEISVYIKCGVSYYHSKRTCVVCPIGHFCNETGLLEPKMCPIGSFTKSTAQTSCKQCPPGFYAPRQGLFDCIPCESGTFNPSFGSEKCLPCNLGYFAKEIGSEKCKLCPKGTYSDSLGNSDCTACPAFSDTDLAYISDSKAKCKCQDGAFFNGIECVDCCHGATCKGYMFQPAARVGFWTNLSLWPSKTCYFIQCENFDDCKSEDFVIADTSSDPSTSNLSSSFANISSYMMSNSSIKQTSHKTTNSNCANLRTSKLCFTCEPGYFKDSFGACHICNDTSVLISFAWRLLLLAIVSGLFLYSCSSKVRSLYILYALLQNICFISRLPLNWSSGARLPFSIAWVAFLKLDFLPLSCWTMFIPNTESGSIKETQAFVYILAVPGLLLFLFVIWALIKSKNSTAPIFRLTIQNLDLVNPQITLQEWPPFYRFLAMEISPSRIEFFKRSVFHAVTMAFSNMLLISSIAALDLLSCRNMMHDGSTGYLLLDPEVDCKTDSKQLMRPVLMLFIFFSTTIFPACCCIKIQLLHIANQYQDEIMVHMYGHFFMRYKRDVYWWEMAVLLRKSLLILAMGAFYDSAVLLVALVLMVFTASILGTVYFKPYRSDLENSAELISMMTQIVIVFAGLYYYSVVSFDPTKADPGFFGYVKEADLCVWIIVSVCIVIMFVVIFLDSKQLFEDTGIKSIFLRLISLAPKSESAAQGLLLTTTFRECDADLMWRYGSSSNRKIVTAVEANSEGEQVTQEISEFQNTSGAVALVQRQVLTVSSENKALISKISKLEIHLKALKDDEESRKNTAEDLERVTVEAKRAISFLENLKRDCDERVEQAQYWSEMLQSSRMQRQSLEKELLAMKKSERSQASLIRTANSHFSKNVSTKMEKP